MEVSVSSWQGTPSHHPFRTMGLSRSQKPSSDKGELETTLHGENKNHLGPTSNLTPAAAHRRTTSNHRLLVGGRGACLGRNWDRTGRSGSSSWDHRGPCGFSTVMHWWIDDAFHDDVSTTYKQLPIGNLSHFVEWRFPWSWGTQQWMVFVRENPIVRNGWLGGTPISGNLQKHFFIEIIRTIPQNLTMSPVRSQKGPSSSWTAPAAGRPGAGYDGLCCRWTGHILEAGELPGNVEEKTGWLLQGGAPVR